jgi:hypothetical protein
MAVTAEALGAADEEARLLERSALLLDLYTRPGTWLKRRIDSAELIDEVGLRWTRTIEFALPPFSGVILGRATPATIPIPLAIHRKDVLVDLKIISSPDCPAWILTHREDQPIVIGMLSLMAEAILGSPPDDETGGFLENLVREWDSGRSRASLVALRRVPGLLEPSVQGESRQRRSVREVLAPITRDLVRNFLLLAEVPAVPGKHMQIQYQFTDFTDFGSVGHGKYSQVEVDIGSLPSYHFEFVAPDELDIAEATAEIPGVSVSASAPLVHVAGRYLSVWSPVQPPGSRCEISFRLRLHRPGLDGVARWTSVGTTLLMILAIIGRVVMNVHPSSDVAAPVVVAVPAGVAALLLRELRHRFTQRIARKARTSLALTSCALAAGAAALAVSVDSAPPLLGTLGLGYRAAGWFLATALSFGVTAWTWWGVREAVQPKDGRV